MTGRELHERYRQVAADVVAHPDENLHWDQLDETARETWRRLAESLMHGGLR